MHGPLESISPDWVLIQFSSAGEAGAEQRACIQLCPLSLPGGDLQPLRPEQYLLRKEVEKQGQVSHCTFRSCRSFLPRDTCRCLWKNLGSVFALLHRYAAHASCRRQVGHKFCPDLSQNRFGSPACLRTAFAVWRDRIFASTTNRRSVSGLYQMSWSPLPCRSKRQPASIRNRFNAAVKSPPFMRPGGGRFRIGVAGARKPLRHPLAIRSVRAVPES